MADELIPRLSLKRKLGVHVAELKQLLHCDGLTLELDLHEAIVRLRGDHLERLGPIARHLDPLEPLLLWADVAEMVWRERGTTTTRASLDGATGVGMPGAG